MGLKKEKNLREFICQNVSFDDFEFTGIIETPVYYKGISFGVTYEDGVYVFNLFHNGTQISINETGTDTSFLPDPVVNELQNSIKNIYPEWENPKGTPKLSELLTLYKKQCIMLLQLGGKTLGFRVCIFDGVLKYYDFNLELLREHRNVYEFLRGNQQRFTVCELIRRNGRLYTEDELRNNIDIMELRSDKEAVPLLSKVMKYYERGYI